MDNSIDVAGADRVAHSAGVQPVETAVQGFNDGVNQQAECFSRRAAQTHILGNFEAAPVYLPETENPLFNMVSLGFE